MMRTEQWVLQEKQSVMMQTQQGREQKPKQQLAQAAAQALHPTK